MIIPLPGRPGPGPDGRHRRRTLYPARHRGLRARARRGLRVPRQGQPARPVRRPSALPWHDIPVTYAATDRGHGRITTRTIQVTNAPSDLPFPHVSQAYLIERHITARDGKPLSDVAALGVTSLDATRRH